MLKKRGRKSSPKVQLPKPPQVPETSEGEGSGDLTPPTPSTSPNPSLSSEQGACNTPQLEADVFERVQYIKQTLATKESSTEDDDEDFVLPPLLKRKKVQPLSDDSSPEVQPTTARATPLPAPSRTSPFKTPPRPIRPNHGFSPSPGKRGVKRDDEVVCWLDGEFMRRGVQRDKR